MKVYRIGVDGLFSCPNRDRQGRGGCAFCDGKGGSAVYQRFDEALLAKSGNVLSLEGGVPEIGMEQRLDSIANQIERGKLFVKRRYQAQAYSLYFQAYTNTYDTIEHLKILYDAALAHGPFVELIVSTRPDCITDEVVSLLAGYRSCVQQVWVELGLESANQQTLDFVGRNHSVACYLAAADSLHLQGIGVCTHVMFGLPYEGRDGYRNTAHVVNQANSDAVKIHNLHVLSATVMENWYLQGELSTASLARHVDQCVFFLRYLDPSVVVERLMCETPNHRRVAPRRFADKQQFLQLVEQTMNRHGWLQGDLT
ncbi:MAG: TIGR01212 family radical SAM protein [Sphaerochaeta sp.]|uniref:TIGR01212 family radical SAM protein n=1 Tax=Sphaerochaeta sp. TaxID=1972642 RepID=UPI002FC8724C